MSAVLESPRRNHARLSRHTHRRSMQTHRPVRAARRLRHFHQNASTGSPWSKVRRSTKEWIPLTITVTLLSLIAALAFFLAMGGAELIGLQDLTWQFTPM